MSEATMGVAGATAPPLPDVNREIHPFGVVQHVLDQTADFCLFAAPDGAFSQQASLTPSQPGDYFGINGGYGIHFRTRLHGFDSTVRPGSVRVEQIAAGAVGTLTCRCLFGSDNLLWAPGHEPEPRIYDPYRSRRFSITDAVFDFCGNEQCSGYGIGRTYPALDGGRAVTMACGVGNITSGRGRFAGLEGTFVMTGFFTPELGFRGSVTLRMVDPLGRLRTDREMNPLSRECDPATGSSFYIFSGHKKDRTVQTTFGPPRGGEMCLITPSEMRTCEFGCQCHGRLGLRAGRRIGPVVTTMLAKVYFNLLAPPGTAAAPVPFTTEETYTFLGPNGSVVGVVEAGVQDGISFDLKFASLRDQPGVRFSGFGPITGGSGCFAGAQGILTVNSLIGISPHALSLVHVLHLLDPEGRFRALRPCRF